MDPRPRSGQGRGGTTTWERYFDRLVRLAHGRLKFSRQARAVIDPEDAARSAFQSFCARAGRGDFPRLADRGELWRLLTTITARKALDQLEREGRLKRGGGRVYREADLAGGDGQDDHGVFGDLLGPEPTPEFAAMVTEEYERLLAALGDDTLRQIARWKLEGFTNQEIGERIGCTRRMVAYRLDLIRKIWREDAP